MRPTDEQITEWRRLAYTATPGPWAWSHPFGDDYTDELLSESVRETDLDESTVLSGAWRQDNSADIEVRDVDAEFIAAAREAVPALLDALVSERIRADKAEDVGRGCAVSDDIRDAVLLREYIVVLLQDTGIARLAAQGGAQAILDRCLVVPRDQVTIREELAEFMDGHRFLGNTQVLGRLAGIEESFVEVCTCEWQGESQQEHLAEALIARFQVVPRERSEP